MCSPGAMSLKDAAAGQPKSPRPTGPSLAGTGGWMTTWMQRMFLKMLVGRSGPFGEEWLTRPTALAAALDYRPDVMLLDIAACRSWMALK